MIEPTAPASQITKLDATGKATRWHGYIAREGFGITRIKNHVSANSPPIGNIQINRTCLPLSLGDLAVFRRIPAARFFSGNIIVIWSLFPTGAKLPNPETVEIYSDSVPDDFLFTVKAPNSITLTHHYSKQPVKCKNIANKPKDYFLNIDLLKRFLEILQPMGKKLGPIMFQFEYLNRQKMPSLKQFLDRLSEFFSLAPKEFDYAVEIRNPNYLKEEYFEFLKDRVISPVLIEGYYMPHISEVVEKFDISAGRTLVIRLMGPDREKIEELTGENWDRVVAPKDKGLDSVAEIVRGQVEQGRDVVVNVNNHYEGCAVMTIGRLVRRMGE